MAADNSKPGVYSVSVKKPVARFSMSRVSSISGTLRLEDKAKGGVLLQLANKTMLLSQRAKTPIVADDCINPTQQEFIAAHATK